MLPPEAIQEFQEIFYRCYGIELSHEEATLRANNLVNLFLAVYEEPEKLKIIDYSNE